MHPPVSLERQVLLSGFTTLRVGGPAAWFVRLREERRLMELLSWAREERVPVCLLGQGSNALVSDTGFDGLVVRMATRGIEVRERGSDEVDLHVSAGESWDGLVRRAIRNGWAGIECLSGIPGTVGAAPVQNVGAYGQEVSDTLTSVDVFDPLSGGFEVLSNQACGFEYRTSRFKRPDGERYVITAVSFRLTRRSPAAPHYPELAAALSSVEGSTKPTLHAVRRAVLSIRLKKSMVLFPGDPNRRSAGSFFMNPVVEASLVERVKLTATERGWGAPPAFASPEGSAKLSAAWLVEHAGFHRGFGEGPAGLSTRHCLALVNRGGARALDILRLAARVRRGVYDTFGVMLHPEPRFIGFSETSSDVLDRVEV